MPNSASNTNEQKDTIYSFSTFESRQIFTMLNATTGGVIGSRYEFSVPCSLSWFIPVVNKKVYVTGFSSTENTFIHIYDTVAGTFEVIKSITSFFSFINIAVNPVNSQLIIVGYYLTTNQAFICMD